jgi:hypothetical protein
MTGNLFQELPDMQALVPQGGGDREQSAAFAMP